METSWRYIMIDEVKKEGDMVNEERPVELIFSLLIASCETTTSTMTAITVKIHNLMFSYS